MFTIYYSINAVFLNMVLFTDTFPGDAPLLVFDLRGFGCGNFPTLKAVVLSRFLTFIVAGFSMDFHSLRLYHAFWGWVHFHRTSF